MRVCSICGKGYKRSFSRSHSNRATIRRLHINLQWLNVGARRVKACAQCIRTKSKSLATTA